MRKRGRRHSGPRFLCVERIWVPHICPVLADVGGRAKLWIRQTWAGPGLDFETRDSRHPGFVSGHDFGNLRIGKTWLARVSILRPGIRAILVLYQGATQICGQRCSGLAAMRFVSGPDFSRAVTRLDKRGLQPLRFCNRHDLTLRPPCLGFTAMRFVSGPDFSRAVTRLDKRGLQPLRFCNKHDLTLRPPCSGFTAMRFVSGPDFSRAVTRLDKRGLQPLRFCIRARFDFAAPPLRARRDEVRIRARLQSGRNEA